LAARASVLATCTVYDATGLTAISACSEFGKPITYGGLSDVRAVFNGPRWYFFAGGHVDVCCDDSLDYRQYRAVVALSDRLTATNYYVIRGGTGLAEVRLYHDGLNISASYSPGIEFFLTYSFPDFPGSPSGPTGGYVYGSPFLYPYNTPFRVAYDVGVNFKSSGSYHGGYLSTSAQVFLAGQNAYIQAVPEPGTAVPIAVVASLLALWLIRKRLPIRHPIA
jgi:hypothetical protein